MNTSPLTFPVVSVAFKGAYYMCVEGSKRADALKRANRAWTMGYDDLAQDLLNEALEAPGCAFEAREAAMDSIDHGVSHQRVAHSAGVAACYSHLSEDRNNG